MPGNGRKIAGIGLKIAGRLPIKGQDIARKGAGDSREVAGECEMCGIRDKGK